MVDALSSLAAPWADLYGDSSLLQALMTFLHIGGIVVAGGLALASDRSTFRVSGRPAQVRKEHLSELGAVHGPVLWGLAVVLLSGMAFFLADVETYLPSWLFWLKMAFFAALLANGLILQRTERGLTRDPDDQGAWSRLRWAAGRSLALWSAVLLLGVLLPLEA